MADPSPSEPERATPEAPPPAAPRPEPAALDIESAEDKAIQLGAHWRRRRFLITLTVYAATWFLMVALIRTGTPSIVYAVFLAPFFLLTLAIALRTPKALRRAQKRTRASRLTWTNRLTIAVAVFVALYFPFSLLSARLVPYAPVFEFFFFAVGLFILYRFVGRAVGVAPSHEALPPATHRLHRQVILAIDDPHYQRTLFLNFEFVDKGRGGRTLARRLGDAMASVGIDEPRRNAVIEDLEEYRPGFRFGFGRGGRERRNSHRERRAQLLSTVYAKFNQALEQSA